MVDVGLLTALFAGVLSFFSPCVLPIVPGYLSFITGFSFDRLTQEQERRREILWVTFRNSLAFVVGFSLVFIALGAAATAVGEFLRAHLKLMGQIAGVVIIVLGIHLTGLYRIPFLLYEKRLHGQESVRGALSALTAGFFFGFGWTPCVGPILAGILALAAMSGTVSRGVVLLSVYSAGLGLGFILAALFVNRFLSASRRIRAHLRGVEVASGVLLLFIGVLISTDQMSRIASRLGFLNPESLVVSRIPAQPAGPAVTLRPVKFDPGPHEFEAPLLQGESKRLSDYGGKIVLVNFWATWCAPCRDEIPGLIDVYREKQSHFEILGIAEESNVNDIEAFVKEMGIEYPILIDPKGRIGEQYRLFAYPTSYLFAPDGTLVRQYTGYLDDTMLRKDLAELERKYGG
ncbi:MAG: redoxin domain-containing protein [Acidobacteria bacterium]|nr:redoxin domain-containing protein [Acidobacteriota bacterium]